MSGFGRRRIVHDCTDASWKRGDLAVCVRDDWTIAAAFHPREGDLLRVKAVYTDLIDGLRVTALKFDGLAPTAGYPSSAFRKPARDGQLADGRFVGLLHRLTSWSRSPVRLDRGRGGLERAVGECV